MRGYLGAATRTIVGLLEPFLALVRVRSFTLHTREVAGSKPAAPIRKCLEIELSESGTEPCREAPCLGANAVNQLTEAVRLTRTGYLGQKHLNRHGGSGWHQRAERCVPFPPDVDVAGHARMQGLVECRPSGARGPVDLARYLRPVRDVVSHYSVPQAERRLAAAGSHDAATTAAGGTCDENVGLEWRLVIGPQ
jgi:hypothetical protein